ncbi:hypothetical protein Tco_0413224 [Tanacetum coccineum]
MANLEFCDKHNMVAYLKKPTESEGFQEIVDFLNGSHIRYALTTNPTIYVSLIEKFWQTATVKKVDNGEQEITAIVDGKEFTVTEASVRRHLQLADVEVIQAAKGEGSGHPSEPQPPPFIAQPTNEEPIPTVVSSSHQKTQTSRQALKEVTKLPQTSEPIPNVPDGAVYMEWDDKVEMATTTAASLDAAHASGGSPRCQEAMGGSIAQTRSEKVPTQSYDSPLPRVNTLGSDEGSMTLHELTVLCTKLSNKVESLEAELKQTKQTFGAAFTKLIKKVKKLEQTVKTSQARRRAKIIISDDEEDEEDPSKQGRSMIEEIDQDAGITLVQINAEDQVTSTQVSAQGEAHTQQDQPEDHLRVFSAAKVLADAARKRREVVHVHSYTRRKRAVSTGSGGISTAEESVKTAGASMPVSTAGMVQEVSIPSPVATKDKDKAIMQESEQPKKIKKRVQIQMILDEELAQKLHEEEQAKFNTEQEVKFNAEQEELLASETTKDEANPSVADIDWDDVQAQIQADKDLAQRML